MPIDTLPSNANASNTSDSSSVTSFLYSWFIPRAYAQVIATDTSSNSSTTSVEQIRSAIGLASSPATTTVSDAVVEVSYTLDGITWISLGQVTADDMPNTTFSIPVNHIHMWSDLSKFQVSVQTLSNLDPSSTLYLDGMSLSVAYASAPKQTPPNSSETPVLDASIGFLPSPFNDNKVTQRLVIATSTTVSFSDSSLFTSGIAVYNPNGVLVVDEQVGNGEEYAHLGDEFGMGDSIIIGTSQPHAC